MAVKSKADGKTNGKVSGKITGKIDNPGSNPVVKKDVKKMTISRLKKLFPEKAKTINQQTVDFINRAAEDPLFDSYSFESSILEYKNVMKNRRSTLQEYIAAVKFCAYVESGLNDYEAYMATFNHREIVQRAYGKPTTSTEGKLISSSASRYKRFPLVQDIFTLSDAPLKLLYHGVRHRAVGVLDYEMQNATYAKDRISAAKAILERLPDAEKIDSRIEVGLNADASRMIENQNKEIRSIAESMQMMLQKGYSIEDIQQIHLVKKKEEEDDIVDVDFEDDFEDDENDEDYLEENDE